jgi:hypothetical protein
MIDDLNQLDPAQLAERVAIEVLGFRKALVPAFAEGSCGSHWLDKEGAVTNERHILRLATSADALLPLMEKFAGYKTERFGDYPPREYYTIRLYPSLMYVETYRQEFTGQGSTFAVAAAIALIRAALAQKGSHA